MRPIHRTLLLAVTVATLGRSTYAGDLPEITIDADDVVITSDTRVKPGTYRVTDANGDGVIHVRGKSVGLDLTGVTLVGADAGGDPSKYAGIGVSIEGGNGIQIVGGAARGFRVGLRAQATTALLVKGFDGSGNRRDRLKSTPEAEDASDWLWPHENDEGQWEARYGAAISLVDCDDATVKACSSHHGQNGLLLSGCNGARIFDNDFSYQSGWGVAMWRSSRCRVARNYCDFCVRGYSHGVYSRGQDSAGFLIFEQCSDNEFSGNSATHSGDGFFLYAGNETLKTTGTGGCNRNRVVLNDFSHAVANGIEATFSDGNVFDRNALRHCDHGVWAGYSTNTIVAKNQLEGCANGVSIEHGTGNSVCDNDVRKCGVGVHLWWDEDEELFDSAYGRAHQRAPSAKNVVATNRFLDCATALRLNRDDGCLVSGNRFDDSGTAIHVSGDGVPPSVWGNRFGPLRTASDSVAVRSDGHMPWRLRVNAWTPFPQKLVGSVTLEERNDGGIAEPAMPTHVEVPIAPFKTAAPSRFTYSDRAVIFVDEWGPLDPSEVRIIGPRPGSTGTPSIHVRGPLVRFTAESLDPAFTVEPTTGPTPAVIRVRPTGPKSAHAFAPYAVRVKVGDKEETFRGSTWALPWRVRFFEWTKDPREDKEAFTKLLAGPAIDEVTMPALDGAWPGTPTPKVRGDQFATVAEAKGVFAAGKYRVHVTSDDGVRVLVDGKVVLEDWTWHGPKDADVDVDLTAGEHSIRVEHFELDGYATLRLRVEPVADHR